MAGRTTVEVEGRELVLSNLDKVLFPASGSWGNGFTKGQVIDYYRRIAPVLLPHLAGRPPTLVRAPDGVGGERFFEKRCPPHHPDWVRTETVVGGGGHQGCMIEELPALIWLANLAALELHTHQWTVADPTHPTAVVIDLDPGPKASVLDCARVALELRDIVEQLGLELLAKTSGGKGMHLSIPLNTGIANDDETKRFALALGRLLESRDPKRVTVDMAKDKRPGRVFVDWSQNDSAKTTVSVYSMRIQERPRVSAPVTWNEVDDALAAGDPDALTFEAPDVLERMEADGDLYEGNLTVHQELPAL